MERIPVQSSNIACIGYDEAANTLEVEFHSGEIYHYFDVPQHLYQALLAADSHGKFFNAYIKKTYRYAKIA